jgi:hypothetical protein
MPSSVPMAVRISANSTDTRNPYTGARAVAARASVPSQFARDGGAGFGTFEK